MIPSPEKTFEKRYAVLDYIAEFGETSYRELVTEGALFNKSDFGDNTGLLRNVNLSIMRRLVESGILRKTLVTNSLDLVTHEMFAFSSIGAAKYRKGLL